MFAVLEGSWNHEVEEVISIQETQQVKNKTPQQKKKKDLHPIFQVYHPLFYKPVGSSFMHERQGFAINVDDARPLCIG
jgi:hypothetical protein